MIKWLFGLIIVLSFAVCQGQSDWKKLNSGEYEWHPERAPSGPLLVVCSIDDQILYLYRNGRLIARSTISTGKAGHETPTGVFSVLQRKVDHESNIYKGAKMPYMQRLTWTGIAMHAGNLPGYPASAGCIRMPYEFSRKLYGEMEMGATVVIAKKNSQPSQSFTPANILMKSTPASENDRAKPKGRMIWNPEKSSTGVIGILLSYADKTMYVWRDGVQIGQSPFGYDFGSEAPVEGVFVMLEENETIGFETQKKGGIFKKEELRPLTRHKWAAVSLHSNVRVEGLKEKMDRGLQIPPSFAERLRPLLVPGSLVVATAEHSSKETRSEKPMIIAVPVQWDE